MSLLIDLLQTSQHPNDKSLQQDSFLNASHSQTDVCGND